MKALLLIEDFLFYFILPEMTIVLFLHKLFCFNISVSGKNTNHVKS